MCNSDANWIFNQPQFKGLKSKRKDELLQIFQRVQDLHNGNDEIEAEAEAE